MDNKRWVNILFSVSLILLIGYFTMNTFALHNIKFGTVASNQTVNNTINPGDGSINLSFSCNLTTDQIGNTSLLMTNITGHSSWRTNPGQMSVNKTNNTDNIRVFNNTEYTFNFTIMNAGDSPMPEGRYFWACGLNSLAETSVNQSVGAWTNQTVNRTFYIDKQPPSQINMTYPISLELTDNTTINLNFSVADAVAFNRTYVGCNLTIDDQASNTFKFRNSTIFPIFNMSSNYSEDVWVNIAATEIDSGTHHWNVSCWDQFRTNSSGGQGIAIEGLTQSGINIGANFTLRDTVAPSAPAAPTFSAASVKSGKIVTITCPAAADSISADPTEKVSVKGPLVSDEYSEIGNSPADFTTSDAGTYTAKCRSTDTAGNTGSFGTTATFKATLGGASADTPAGGSGSSAITGTVLRGATVEIGELTEGEQGRGIYEKGTVTFSVAGASHSAQITDIDLTNQQVTVTISSNPVVLTVGVGETKQVDVNEDGSNDMEVELLAIDAYGKAEIVFRSLVDEGGKPITTEEGETTAPTTTPTTTPVKGGGVSAWIIVLLIMVVVIVVIILLRSRRQRG